MFIWTMLLKHDDHGQVCLLVEGRIVDEKNNRVRVRRKCLHLPDASRGATGKTRQLSKVPYDIGTQKITGKMKIEKRCLIMLRRLSIVSLVGLMMVTSVGMAFAALDMMGGGKTMSDMTMMTKEQIAAMTPEEMAAMCKNQASMMTNKQTMDKMMSMMTAEQMKMMTVLQSRLFHFKLLTLFQFTKRKVWNTTLSK